jgi:hypothetical protein
VKGDAVLEIADICTRLRDRIRVIVDDLPLLKSQADPNDPLALHIIDRVLVATVNATGCAVLAEQNLAAALVSAERSIFESLLAVYWSSQKEENATILLSVMRREMMRLMRLNLQRGHAVIRHKETGAIHTQEILDDPKISEAGRPPSFRTMAEQAGLGKLYDTSYGFMSMLAHGTATELLAKPGQRDLVSAQLHSVSAFLRCIYLIAVNRIRENRATSIVELESILKISLA